VRTACASTVLNQRWVGADQRLCKLPGRSATRSIVRKLRTPLQKQKAEIAKAMHKAVKAAVDKLGPKTAAAIEKHRRKGDARCYSCGRKPDTMLCRDHHHESETFRGLLCIPCNLALGLLRDDIERVEALAEYLRRPPPLGDEAMIFDD
jgi:hypothetical protein